MFKNEYQGGPYFEVFSPQNRDSVANWKLGPGVKKIYEKEVKGYVYVLEGTSTTSKIHLPKDNRQTVTLVQRFMIFQLYLAKGQDFSIEIGVCDLSNNRRRIQLSSAQKEMQITPLHARIPLMIIRRGLWLNLCLDMVSLVGETWIGQTFHAVDCVTVSANCKLRRIFTVKSQPPDTTDDDELYGCLPSNSGEIESVPKQVQLAPDIVHCTQVLTVHKIKCAEKIKGGKAVGMTDASRSGSLMDLDLTTSMNKGPFHIAFGSKVSAPAPESSRKSGRQGSSTNRSVGSTLSRTDAMLGSVSVKDLHDSVVSQDGLLHGGIDQEIGMASGVNQSHLVTPHPPREPSNDRVRRYHRVKSLASSSVLSNNIPIVINNGKNPSKDKGTSTASLPGKEGETDCSISSQMHFSSMEHPNILTNVDKGKNQPSQLVTTFSTLKNEELKELQASSTTVESESHLHFGPSVQDSVSDVIALLKTGGPERGASDLQSSESGTESSQPGEYEESDDEDSNTTSKLHVFESRPMLAPRRNVSPSTADQEQTKRSHTKSLLSNFHRSVSEMLSPRGARLEDDFHSSITSSDEDDNFQKHSGGPGSRPHSGTSASGSPKARSGSGQGERSTSGKDRIASFPKVSLSPDLKRPPFNPSLYGDSIHNHLEHRKGQGITSQTLRRSRKSVREIKPHVEDNASRKSFEKMYDYSKYQMAEVTESFEQRMFASMQQEEEEELEDICPFPSHTGTQPIIQHPHRVVHMSQQLYSESPVTTSDDDTSFSTWKAPAPNQMAHNYQDEMKSRLSSDTLTSSNPRDWTSIFSPPIVLPSDHDPEGTLQGHFQDLEEIPVDSITATSEIPNTEDEEELDLMFDANLNCYYDPKTLKYYELVT